MITVLKFYADWCRPCQNMNPIVDDLREKYKDRVVFTDINIDTDPNLRQEYHITSIPNFVVIKDGAVSSRFPRSGSRQELEEWIDGELGIVQSDVLPETSAGS